MKLYHYTESGTLIEILSKDKLLLNSCDRYAGDRKISEEFGYNANYYASFTTEEDINRGFSGRQRMLTKSDIKKQPEYYKQYVKSKGLDPEHGGEGRVDMVVRFVTSKEKLERIRECVALVKVDASKYSRSKDLNQNEEEWRFFSNNQAIYNIVNYIDRVDFFFDDFGEGTYTDKIRNRHSNQYLSIEKLCIENNVPVFAYLRTFVEDPDSPGKGSFKTVPFNLASDGDLRTRTIRARTEKEAGKYQGEVPIEKKYNKNIVDKTGRLLGNIFGTLQYDSKDKARVNSLVKEFVGPFVSSQELSEILTVLWKEENLNNRVFNKKDIQTNYNQLISISDTSRRAMSIGHAIEELVYVLTSGNRNAHSVLTALQECFNPNQKQRLQYLAGILK